MDLIISLLSVHGKSCIFVLIDHLTTYLHYLAIYIQCIAPQEGKFIFWLHGLSKTNIRVGDNHFLYGFWKVLCYCLYAKLIHNSIYYLLVDEMTCTTSKLLGDNLPHDVLKHQLEKLHCNHLGNCWYLPALHETFNIFLIWMTYGDDVLFIIYEMV